MSIGLIVFLVVMHIFIAVLVLVGMSDDGKNDIDERDIGKVIVWEITLTCYTLLYIAKGLYWLYEDIADEIKKLGN